MGRPRKHPIQVEPTLETVEPSPPTVSASEALPPQAEPSPAPSEDEFINIFEEARREDVKRTFVSDVMKARNPPVVVYVPPPLPPAVVSQTNAEMAAGAAVVAKHEAEEVLRPKRPRENDGNTVAVFRPGDYIPDPKKNQGHTNPRTLSSG